MLSALDALLDEEAALLLDAGVLDELDVLSELAGLLSALDALLDEVLTLLLDVGGTSEVAVLPDDAGTVEPDAPGGVGVAPQAVRIIAAITAEAAAPDAARIR